MARPIKVITAGAEIRAELQRRANAPTSAHRDRFRAKIILLRLEGLKIATVAKRLKTSMPTVSTWSARFEAHGLDGLNDKSGRGRKPSITEKKIERVVTDATRPPTSKPISPIAMRPRNPTPGRPKAPQSSRKSTAPAPPSIKSRQHELLQGN